MAKFTATVRDPHFQYCCTGERCQASWAGCAQPVEAVAWEITAWGIRLIANECLDSALPIDLVITTSDHHFSFTCRARALRCRRSAKGKFLITCKFMA